MLLRRSFACAWRHRATTAAVAHRPALAGTGIRLTRSLEHRQEQVAACIQMLSGDVLTRRELSSSPLPDAQHTPTVISSAQGFSNALKENEIVVLDCHADWCGPCRLLGPMLEKKMFDQPDSTPSEKRINLATLDVDLGQSDAQLGAILRQLNVSGIPAVFTFVGGKLVRELSFTGALPQKDLDSWFGEVQALAEQHAKTKKAASAHAATLARG